MKALSRTAAVLFCVSLTGIEASAQVKVVVPEKLYKQHEKIDVEITNRSSMPVSYCVEFGHWSFRDVGEMEVTPTPVYVQAKRGRRWSTLLIGPDVGSGRHSVILEAGETQHYPFRLTAVGKMRVLLDYWIGASDPTCEKVKGRKTAKSVEFVVE